MKSKQSLLEPSLINIDIKSVNIDIESADVPQAEAETYPRKDAHCHMVVSQLRGHESRKTVKLERWGLTTEN